MNINAMAVLTHLYFTCFFSNKSVLSQEIKELHLVQVETLISSRIQNTLPRDEVPFHHIKGHSFVSCRTIILFKLETSKDSRRNTPFPG